MIAFVVVTAAVLAPRVFFLWAVTTVLQNVALYWFFRIIDWIFL